MNLGRDRFTYAVLLTLAAEGGWVVTCRDLPALITQGENRQDALAQAIDAMDELFTALILGRHDLPPPSPRRRGEVNVELPSVTAAKARRYIAMRETGSRV